MPHDHDELGDLVEQVAHTALGLERLRPGQEEAAAAVLAGHDVLAVMPTGAGKSAIYQIAGALVPGATVVVSPLIALQQDQVAAIGDGLGGARQVNSSMSEGERRAAFGELGDGELEFLFVAPEQLANPETLERVKAGHPSLFVVDEAHCISAWGHDFRPDYLRLGSFIEALGRPQIIALTATAAPPVRREIVEELRMRDPVVVVSGFMRPNIHLAVETHADHEHIPAVVDRAVATPGTGIVYVATRRQAEELASEIAARGKAAAAYHAGLARGQRDEVHARFLDGEDIVVVATIAFGMGIDAPHVRFVLHVDPPESLDAYYQEVGRAGRDGQAARAVLFRTRQGAGGRRFFAGTVELPGDVLATVAEAAAAAAEPIPLPSLAAVAKTSESRLTVAVDRLQRVGAVEVDGTGSVAWTGGTSVEQLVDRAAADHERYRTTDRTRAEMMQRYLETEQCRWRTILGYFGELSDENCDHCDNCDAGHAAPAADAADGQPFPLGARVVHATFGTGEVVAYDDDTMTVLFDEAGYRSLSVGLVRAGDLLQPA
ncbi:MAG TPA: RecQ family ATP-dependent DNA helicase [Acidimicrobiia bacterium]|nr:RecQ family ATP-dependent DNA helicase [Acidimicrobiia bacterium]